MKKEIMSSLLLASAVFVTGAQTKKKSTIVVYESQAGHTKQYAQWISEELDCECKSRDEISKAQLKNYETVIYGGWIMADRISGYDKVKKHISPDVVFAVGACPAYEEVVEELREKNKLSVPFFYFQGGMNAEKLGFLQKKMIGMAVSQTKKKENRTRKEDFVVEYLGTNFDFSSKEQIQPLLESLRNEQ